MNSGDTYLISGSWDLAFACGGSDLLAPRLDSRTTHLPTADRCACGAVVPRSHRVGRKGCFPVIDSRKWAQTVHKRIFLHESHRPPCAGPLVVPRRSPQTSKNPMAASFSHTSPRNGERTHVRYSSPGSPTLMRCRFRFARVSTSAYRSSSSQPWIKTDFHLIPWSSFRVKIFDSLI